MKRCLHTLVKAFRKLFSSFSLNVTYLFVSPMMAITPQRLKNEEKEEEKQGHV